MIGRSGRLCGVPTSVTTLRLSSSYRLEEDADREGIINVMQGLSLCILDDSVNMWKGEWEYDSSEAEEGSIPTRDTDESTSAWLELGAGGGRRPAAIA